jgi:hypothetical protein
VAYLNALLERQRRRTAFPTDMPAFNLALFFTSASTTSPVALPAIQPPKFARTNIFFYQRLPMTYNPT